MTHNKYGDTIVEVMIAIVVLGAAIGGAFAITNKSQLKTQANHERYQAQMFLNQQAELLRKAYYDYTSGTGQRSNFKSTITDTVTVDETSTNGCFNIDASWSGVSCTIYSLYTVKFVYVDSGEAKTVDSAVAPLTYKIIVEWDSLSSGGKDRVELLYGL